MARPQKYNQTKVMNTISNLFQTQGYRGTSIDQLLEATELSRSSLYNGFGNKESIYLMVLDDIAVKSAVLYKDSALSNNPEEFIRIFFMSYQPDKSHYLAGSGCLLVNTVVELADSEPDLVNRAQTYLQQAQDSMASYFKLSQQNGLLAKHHNPMALAKFFMNVKKGLMVSVRHGTDIKDLDDVIDISLLIIK